MDQALCGGGMRSTECPSSYLYNAFINLFYLLGILFHDLDVIVWKCTKICFLDSLKVFLSAIKQF